MKQLLSTALALVCVVLVIILIVIKNTDSAQHDSDATAINDLSNQLTSAQSQITARDATILTISNNLSDAQSALLVSSNHVVEAESTIVSDMEQITNLNQQVAEMKSENQALGRGIMDLTNQMAGLTKQLTLTQASLAQTNKDLVQEENNYALLENRFRIDVAERVVVERKFNNISELKTQMLKLKENPAGEVSAESIYSGLNVEVKSNGWFHVITPN